MSENVCYVEHRIFKREVVCHTCKKVLLACLDGALGLSHDELLQAEEQTAINHLTNYDTHRVEIRDGDIIASYQMVIPVFMLPPNIQEAVKEASA